MPITAGPQAISLFQRTGPANRTANPSRVVLPQCSLMAVVQRGSAGAWSKRRVAPPCRRQGDGPLEHQRPAQPVRPPRQDHRSVLLDQSLEVVARPGNGPARRGLGCPASPGRSPRPENAPAGCARPPRSISASTFRLLSSRYGGKNRSADLPPAQLDHQRQGGRLSRDRDAVVALGDPRPAHRSRSTPPRRSTARPADPSPRHGRHPASRARHRPGPATRP